jgi:hypothetical protein
MKIIKEPNGPVVEIVNPPKGGTTMQKHMIRSLLKLAEMNKAKRLLIVFGR